MDVTDFIVLLVGLAVVTIVVYGGYLRAMQNRQARDDRSKTGYAPSGVPAE